MRIIKQTDKDLKVIQQMGSACNYCQKKPREDLLVRLKCNHHICFTCISLNAEFCPDFMAYIKCKNCNQKSKINTQRLPSELFDIKIKYGREYYNLKIEASSTTEARIIKQSFIEKMNKQVMKNTQLKKDQFMLRIINEGFIFEEHLIFSIRNKLLQLQIGMAPQNNGRKRQPQNR